MQHPVYHTLNLRLKIGPADSALFLFGLFVSFLFALLFSSVPGALVLFCFLYSLAVLVGQKDPNWLRFWWHGSTQKVYYDPAK
jgi:hypothetical protein